ncbi:MAG: hypothetical protein ABSH22_22250, partial [Tepidisphaeraceae bacterium]
MRSTITTLLFAPTKQLVVAEVVPLTAIMAEDRIHRDWWTEESLLDEFRPEPIDRHWLWSNAEIT